MTRPSSRGSRRTGTNRRPSPLRTQRNAAQLTRSGRPSRRTSLRNWRSATRMPRRRRRRSRRRRWYPPPLSGASCSRRSSRRSPPPIRVPAQVCSDHRRRRQSHPRRRGGGARSGELPAVSTSRSPFPCSRRARRRFSTPAIRRRELRPSARMDRSSTTAGDWARGCSPRPGPPAGRSRRGGRHLRRLLLQGRADDRDRGAGGDRSLEHAIKDAAQAALPARRTHSRDVHVRWAPAPGLGKGRRGPGLGCRYGARRVGGLCIWPTRSRVRRNFDPDGSRFVVATGAAAGLQLPGERLITSLPEPSVVTAVRFSSPVTRSRPPAPTASPGSGTARTDPRAA